MEETKVGDTCAPNPLICDKGFNPCLKPMLYTPKIAMFSATRSVIALTIMSNSVRVHFKRVFEYITSG